MIIVNFSNEQIPFDMSKEDLIVLNQEYGNFSTYINKVTADNEVQKLVEAYHDIVKRAYKGSDFETFKDSKNYTDLMNAVFEDSANTARYFMNGILYYPESDIDDPHVEMFIGG